MENRKKIAIPLEQGLLTRHFGHCENFAIIETEGGKIVSVDSIDPPEHKPGAYPMYLVRQGIDVVIAGRMGSRARDLLARKGIEVHVGVSSEPPIAIVEHYLENTLVTGQEFCDHKH